MRAPASSANARDDEARGRRESARSPESGKVERERGRAESRFGGMEGKVVSSSQRARDQFRPLRRRSSSQTAADSRPGRTWLDSFRSLLPSKPERTTVLKQDDLARRSSLPLRLVDRLHTPRTRSVSDVQLPGPLHSDSVLNRISEPGESNENKGKESVRVVAAFSRPRRLSSDDPTVAFYYQTSIRLR